MREASRATGLADRTVQSTVEAPERPTGLFSVIGQLPRKVVATYRRDFTRSGRNPWGGFLTAPSPGAKGIAGVRSDIIAGVVTERQVAMMPAAEMKRRYGVCPARASYIRRHIAEYGLGGKCRLPDNTPRPLPLPSPGTDR